MHYVCLAASQPASQPSSQSVSQSALPGTTTAWRWCCSLAILLILFVSWQAASQMPTPSFSYALSHLYQLLSIPSVTYDIFSIGFHETAEYLAADDCYAQIDSHCVR